MTRWLLPSGKVPATQEIPEFAWVVWILNIRDPMTNNVDVHLWYLDWLLIGFDRNLKHNIMHAFLYHLFVEINFEICHLWLLISQFSKTIWGYMGWTCPRSSGAAAAPWLCSCHSGGSCTHIPAHEVYLHYLYSTLYPIWGEYLSIDIYNNYKILIRLFKNFPIFPPYFWNVFQVTMTLPFDVRSSMSIGFELVR